jgi:hypothetical protein
MNDIGGNTGYGTGPVIEIETGIETEGVTTVARTTGHKVRHHSSSFFITLYYLTSHIINLHHTIILHHSLLFVNLYHFLSLLISLLLPKQSILKNIFKLFLLHPFIYQSYMI